VRLSASSSTSSAAARRPRSESRSRQAWRSATAKSPGSSAPPGLPAALRASGWGGPPRRPTHSTPAAARGGTGTRPARHAPCTLPGRAVAGGCGCCTTRPGVRAIR
jgi:hypothetical protein